MKNEIQEKIEKAAQSIQAADSILITAGAGMSVDSGLPDFRGTHGLWRAFPPLAHLGLDFEAMACPDLFDENPRLAWGFYGLRLESYRQAKPHQGYQLLKQWGKNKAFGTYVWTSNVDGHFAKAGFATERIIEKHGSIHLMQCSRDCKKSEENLWSSDNFIPQVDIKTSLLLNDLPTCPYCGVLARPNILMFDDYFWLENALTEKKQRFENQWLKQVSSLVIIEIGAGKALPLIRHFSDRMARRKFAQLIRINPDAPQVPQMHHIGLPMRGLEALQAIDTAMRQYQ